MKFKIFTTFLLMLMPFLSFGQSLKRPTIWADQSDKGRIISKIDKYTWAQDIVDDLHKFVDETVDEHQENPETILKSIPEFAAHSKFYSDAAGVAPVPAHNKILLKVNYAALLYYITGEDKYASFTADVIMFYLDKLAQRTPQTTTISGSGFFDPRATYSHIALSYDFIYDYLQKSRRKVYNLEKGRYVKYDNDLAQKGFTNIVGDALQEFGKADEYGSMISNHPILTSTGTLYSILCIDDDAERERLLNVFWEVGTKHQNSFKNTILPMFGSQGIWPESLSYSFMPNVSVVMNILDRLKPELNIAEDYKHVLEGNFLFDNLRGPDRQFVRYGDSHRPIDQTETLYRITLDIAKRHNFTDLIDKANVALSQYYAVEGGYKPVVSSGVFDNNKAMMALFWCDDLPEVDSSINFQTPTVVIEHAGIALQRNYVEKDNYEYGMCGIIGGGFYVHSQVTGIALELYGAGYYMATGGGLPHQLKNRKIPLHQNYYVRHAGCNTIIINGETRGGTRKEWRSNGHLWQNNAVNIAAEPAHLENPVNSNFSFATQHLDDDVNKCEQERTLALLRTSETTGYYLDFFRSKALGENKFQDYIFHNIGDKMHITNFDGDQFDMTATDRFQNEIGDGVQSPGWCFFDKDATVSPLTSETVKVRFDVDYNGRYMHMLIPAGVDREYAQTLAPPTREAKNGYEDKKSQLLAIRQYSEAWDKAYVAVLEANDSKRSSVKTVSAIKDGEKVIGADVISFVDGSVVRDIIICQDSDDAEYQDAKNQIYFKGRYAVIRTTRKTNEISAELYIGDGDVLKYQGATLNGGVKRCATMTL